QSCRLGDEGKVRHVIYVQFDNTHLMRDRAGVPSDLQQMPNLLNFIESNGVLLSNHHTPLIAHTADDILTSETSLYGDRHGMPISNEYRYYTPSGTTDTAGSFAYWTDPIVDYDTSNGQPVGDSLPTMVTSKGAEPPAPWVPYTRAGCNFGAVAAANTELENNVPDVANVFGPNSPQAMEASNPNLQNQASADFQGLAIHCAAGASACASANTGVPDLLPNEPGGYTGFQALFGNKYVQPIISPNGPVTDLYGNVIKDSSGDIGFPGYDGMTGANALAYTADMQEHGVPVTYTYLTDLHASWQTGNAFGPGEAGYEAQLQAENAAFGVFFHRLAQDGITSANTLFMFTADEGDHFVGGPPSPTNCDGVTVPCTYSQIGELDVNLNGVLATEQNITTPFDVRADSAPELYMPNQPDRTSSDVRTLERATGQLTAQNLITNQTVPLTRYMADPVEMNLLHMITGDPKRTPTFAMFADPNFYVQSGPPNCGSPCVTENSAEAWNHGDVAPEINTTWLGIVAPGVAHRGVNSTLWSDETDNRPTILALVGLKDDYQDEGVPLFQVFDANAVPPAIRHDRDLLSHLAQIYKQIDAPVGRLGLDSLIISTRALKSGSASDDSTYNRLETVLTGIRTSRDDLLTQIRTMLQEAAFDNKTVDRQQTQDLVSQGQALLDKVHAQASAGH
ncbi:MAG: hypothetical protein M3Z66_14610, partial [Chloroflexota bacterium]|nr:hypothetical protein [Chloroflexota bacterium]